MDIYNIVPIDASCTGNTALDGNRFYPPHPGEGNLRLYYWDLEKYTHNPTHCLLIPSMGLFTAKMIRITYLSPLQLPPSLSGCICPFLFFSL